MTALGVAGASFIATGLMVAALILLFLLVSNLGIANGMSSNVNVFGDGLLVIRDDEPGRRVIVHTYFLSVDRDLRTILESRTVHLVNREDNLSIFVGLI